MSVNKPAYERLYSKKIKVLVIFGGCSSEHDISLLSAWSVLSHINTEKYEPIMLGITKEGKWYRYYGEISKIRSNRWHSDYDNCRPALISPDRNTRKLYEFTDGGFCETEFDIAFPVLHGKNGEDGTVQGMLELAGIPIVGCNTLASALCMDKDRAHSLARIAGIRTPLSTVFSSVSDLNMLINAARRIQYPLYVKPVRAGSSIGISKVLNEEQLLPAVKKALSNDECVIIEESIEGFEVGCAILGNDELIVGELDEIELDTDFFSFEEKYSLKASRIHMPARIDSKLTIRVKKTASRIYRALGCRGFARIDMFITPDRKIIFNEVNTIPGLTEHSRYPNMMKGIGIQLADVLDRLIELGIKHENY